MDDLEKDQRIWGVLINNTDTEVYEIKSTHIDSLVAKAKAFELKDQYPNNRVAVVCMTVVGII